MGLKESDFMGKNLTATMDVNSSLTSNVTVTVEVYSVFVNFAALLLISLPGIIINIAMLISTRYKKGIRCLQYGLHYTLFIINILMCCAWAPLHSTQLYINYTGNKVADVVCYLSSGLFHMGVSSIVFLTVVLGLLHLHHLSSSPIPVIRSLVKRGISASIFSAILLTGITIAEQPYNMTFEICKYAKASDPSAYKFWYSLISMLLFISYTIMLLVMMVLLWLAVQAIRQRIKEMMMAARNSQNDRINENQEDTYEVSREEPSKHSSVTFKDPEISETIPNKNGISKIGNNVTTKGITFQNPEISNHDNDEDDEEEDAFDLKMRMQLQKASSGRRHTVANIGLVDGLFGSKRRGSLDVQRSPTAPQHYNYIRKWSVDITALQNQLENPKVHTGSYPFRELGILPEKDPATHEEVDEEKEEAMEDEKSAEQPMITEKFEKSGDASDNNKEHSSGTEVPSIVIDDGNEDSGWVTSHDGNQDQEENNHIDEEVIRRFHKQLRKSKFLILFYFMTLLTLIPYLLIQILQVTLDINLAINMSYVTAPVCLLTSIIQPMVLLQMDTRLNQAISRLWIKITHWKCVCYCNIGSGKKFFGKPTDLEDKAET